MKRSLFYFLAMILVVSTMFTACDFGSQPEETQSVEQETEPEESLEYEYWADGTCRVEGIGTWTSAEVVIPTNAPRGNLVTGINDYAFRGNTHITSLIIPDSVTAIGQSAFDGCSGLTSITISAGVTEIGPYAFSDCSGLTNISVSENNPIYYSEGNCLIEKERKWMILGCQSSEIPSDVKNIYIGAFSGCIGLTSITIPYGVENLAVEAFCNCENLAYITIPGSVKSMGWDVFSGCDSLTDIYFTGTEDQWNAIVHTYYYEDHYTGDMVPEEASLHYNSSAPVPDTENDNTLEEDTVEPGVDDTLTEDTAEQDVDETVADIATEVYFSSNGDGTCSVVSYSPLRDKDGIVVIPETSPEGDVVTSIDQGVFAQTSLVSVTIPDGVTEILDYTFAGCYELKEVKLSNNLTRIGEMAFSECSSLTSIVLPDSLISIDYGAFFACENLTDVYYAGSEEEWAEIEIGVDNDDLCYATIHYNYVPKE